MSSKSISPSDKGSRLGEYGSCCSGDDIFFLLGMIFSLPFPLFPGSWEGESGGNGGQHNASWRAAGAPQGYFYLCFRLDWPRLAARDCPSSTILERASGYHAVRVATCIQLIATFGIIFMDDIIFMQCLNSLYISPHGPVPREQPRPALFSAGMHGDCAAKPSCNMAGSCCMAGLLDP